MGPFFHLKLNVKKKLHIGQHKSRQTPPKYPVGSWRWLLLDRHVPVHLAGPAHRGFLPGQIVSYDKFGVGFAVGQKFPKGFRAWHRLTYVKFWKCDCQHRLWSWRAAAIGQCDRHDWMQQWVEQLREAMDNSDKWVSPELSRKLTQ